MSLGAQLKPCGPVVDGDVVEAAFGRLGSTPSIAAAWPALAPVVAASPYLAKLIVAAPERLAGLLDGDPEAVLEALIAAVREAPLDPELPACLRRLKVELHLLVALCDLGGLWALDAVTAALSDFADASVQRALAAAVEAERAGGKLIPAEPGAPGLPGFFILALGKHGARELNYSSDIDISVFYDPEALPTAPGVEPQRIAQRITQAVARALGEITADGYVFRVDLRLRPDPSSTPVAVPVEQALDYYGAVGQNWERAALIKARPCAGDRAAAGVFLEALQPFIWRRALDYAAIADIHSIKRQIHVHKGFDDAQGALASPGADLKLGAGGIREIEFFVQTQQLIGGGRDASLRSPRTLDALAALVAAGHVDPAAAEDLSSAYQRLRGWEHRVQMLHDAQTHRLPVDGLERGRVAALSGFGNGAGFADLAAFDRLVCETRTRVNARYGELFADDEELSSRAGSLVFTGVDDDPETLSTLARLGFSSPESVSATIRSWHHGRINATRTARGRELFTRLAPRLLDACAATGAADPAFARFADFFAGLRTGVQVQSLFLAQPALFALVIRTLAVSPRMATILARRPAVLDALLDADFFSPLEPRALAEAVRLETGRVKPGEGAFEAAMDAARRAHAEQSFRIGVHLIDGLADAVAAGRAFAALAEACLAALAPAALAEVERLGGAFEGDVAVVALGAFGGEEMTARSDLDLMAVYRVADPAAASSVKGWAGETVYGRFTQRLVAALSAPTAEGGLYEVDLQLRPSGTAGPVAVSLAALQSYYEGEAQSWELMALTRARVAWATSAPFAGAVETAIDTALRRPRDPVVLSSEVRDMRALMEKERPASGFWDLKLSKGGLVDVEFAAQHLQLANAAGGGPLRRNTGEALDSLKKAKRLDPEAGEALLAAWRLSRSLAQVLRLTLEGDGDPEEEPAGLKAMVAQASGVERFEAVRPLLAALRARARAVFQAVSA